MTLSGLVENRNHCQGGDTGHIAGKLDTGPPGEGAFFSQTRATVS